MLAARAHPTSSTRSSVIVWAILVALLVASVLLGHVHNAYLMNALVFSVAIVKAMTVLIRFMHIKLEPKILALILFSAAVAVIILVLGAAPDVTSKFRVSETPTSL